MKTCPVCHARCFDDMEVCYGCLHRFSDGEEAQAEVEVEEPDPSSLPPQGASASADQAEGAGGRSPKPSQANVPGTAAGPLQSALQESDQVLKGSVAEPGALQGPRESGASRIGDDAAHACAEAAGGLAAPQPVTIDILAVPGQACGGSDEVPGVTVARKSVAEPDAVWPAASARIQLVISLQPAGPFGPPAPQRAPNAAGANG